MQKNIYEKIGDREDQVLQGHGTTNTGNVARKCFQYPEAFSKALQINTQLVVNIARIISAFKCKKELKLDKLEEFCWETYRLYYELYPWARMSPTVHKLLKRDISRQLLLPQAYYAEDANKSWHKLYRQNMTLHARQNSRENRISDVFNRAIYFSDPKISLILISSQLKRHKQHISSDVQEFIVDE